MLCYRCGSHVPDTTDTCPTCGLKFDAAARQAAGAARKRGADGAPYKPGDVVAGRYAIQEVVGAGPLGFVFRAQDQQIDVEVALKVIQPRLVQQPEERTQFTLSLRVGKKLNHPNLVRVYEEGVDGDRPFFTMQLLEGTSLRRMMEQRAARGQLFSLNEVEPLLAQMAAALDGAHRFGPHSDFKPENVIVLPDLLKVTDYGLGLAVPHLPFVQAQKGQRSDVYIAPEYVHGGELDTRMDVYSLGVIMGELVTGLVPDAGIPPELLVNHPDLPPAFDALYRRALNANPLARPKSAGELHAELVSVIQRSPAAAARARQRPTPETAALSSVARASSNLPPPVPTGMLPSIPPPGVASPGVASPGVASPRPPPGVASPGVAAPRPPPAPAPPKHEPPPDATQPLDEATLAAILGAQSKAPKPEPVAAPEPRPPARAPAPSPAAPRASEAATIQDMRSVSRVPDTVQDARSVSRASEAATIQDMRSVARAPEPPAARPAPQTSEPAPAARSSPQAQEPAARAAPRAQEPAPRAAPRAAEPAAARQESRDLEASPATSGARSGPRTLDSSPAVSGARTGPRTLDSAPAVSGARTGPRNLEPSPATSAARIMPREGTGNTRAMRRKPSRSRSLVWLAVLAVAGVALGAGGGYLLVKRLNPPGGPVPPRQAPPPGGVVPASPAGQGSAGGVVPAGDCRGGMRLVSGGAFKMGTPPDDTMKFVDERPLQSVQVASFCVDEYEYPNQPGGMPRVGVSWTDAQLLCEREGKRLCTEEEWEKACKGPGNARFPYGTAFDASVCNTEDGEKKDRALAPSGKFTRCRSGYGVADLSGNVAEWTATRYGANADMTQKGGAFDAPDYTVRCSARKNGVPSEKLETVGFRCCSGVGP